MSGFSLDRILLLLLLLFNILYWTEDTFFYLFDKKEKVVSRKIFLFSNNFTFYLESFKGVKYKLCKNIVKNVLKYIK